MLLYAGTVSTQSLTKNLCITRCYTGRIFTLDQGGIGMRQGLNTGDGEYQGSGLPIRQSIEVSYVVTLQGLIYYIKKKEERND